MSGEKSGKPADTTVVDALDEIAMIVSYIVTHGVGEQPEPNGQPQIMRVSPQELGHLIHRIGNTARAALANARGQEPSDTRYIPLPAERQNTAKDAE